MRPLESTRRAAAANDEAPSESAPRPKRRSHAKQAKVTGRSRALLVGLGLCALIAFWIALRIFPANEVVLRQDGTTRLFDTDSYYHLRHVQSIVEHYPRLLRWDAGTHFPHGQRSSTTGLFDFSIATAALIAGAGSPSPTTVERAAAFAPVVLSALALFSLFLLVRRVAGPIAALGAVAMTVLAPGELAHRSSLGFADHHVAELLLLLLSALGWCYAFDNREGSTGVTAGRGRLDRWLGPNLRPWLRAALAASPMAALFFTWVGAPLYVALLCACAWLAMNVAVARGRFEASDARAPARVGVALAVLLGAPGVLLPSLVLLPKAHWWSVGGALGIAVAFRGAEWLLPWLERKGLPSWSRAIVLLGLPVLGALALYATMRDIRLLISTASLKAPILKEQRVADFSLVFDRLGTVPLLALLGPPLTLLDRGRKGVVPFFLAVTGPAVLALWWFAHDYGYVVGSLCSASAALGLACLFRRLLLPAPRRAFWLLPLFGGLLLCPFALGSKGRPWLTKANLEGLVVLDDAMIGALTWMRKHTPEPPLDVTTPVAPWQWSFHYPSGSYGVISGWEIGNFVAAIGHRTPVSSQGLAKNVIDWMLQKDENAGIDFWRKRGAADEPVRYVVLDAKTLGDRFVALASALGTQIDTTPLPGSKELRQLGPTFTESTAARLYIGGANGLSHYRLIHDTEAESLLYHRQITAARSLVLRSAPLDDALPEVLSVMLRNDRAVRQDGALYYNPLVRPTVRIFELVAGARIRGHAAPGADVRATIRLRWGKRSVRLEYSWQAHADADGRYELVVPYATKGEGDMDVVALGPYRLEVSLDGQPLATTEVEVSEADVQSGAGVEVADLP